MNDNPLNKARELSISILNSIEYKKMKQYEEQIFSDENLMKTYKKTLELKKNEDNLEKKNEVITNYINAKKDFENLISNINTIVAFMIGYKNEKNKCISCEECKKN